MQCQDPDGDGLLSLYDNCDFVANAGQQDCDHDNTGDACDALSATVTTFTDITTSVLSAGNVCVGAQLGGEGQLVLEETLEVRTRTYETRVLCGPSGTGTQVIVTADQRSLASCYVPPTFATRCSNVVQTILPFVCPAGS